MDIIQGALGVGGLLLPNGIIIEPSGSNIVFRRGATIILTMTPAGILTPGTQGSAYTQTYSTANKTHADLTAADLTDSTTGSASTTLAAGVGLHRLSFAHTFIGGTDAVEPVTNLTLGYKFKILSWAFITDVLLAGAGGSRVANMEIGSTDVGTVVSTCTIPIANAAVGTVTAGTAVSGANTGSSSATFSIEIAASGTEFTAGKGQFSILVQNMDTADALASLAAQTDALLVDLTDVKQLANSIIDDLQTLTLVL